MPPTSTYKVVSTDKAGVRCDTKDDGSTECLVDPDSRFKVEDPRSGRFGSQDGTHVPTTKSFGGKKSRRRKIRRKTRKTRKPRRNRKHRKSSKKRR